MNWKTYLNAPITEAILDIRTRLDSDALPQIEAMAPLYFADFPKFEHVKLGSLEARFMQEGGPLVSAEDHSIGFQLLSSDGADRLVLTVNGITVGRLAPYHDWAHLRDMGRRVWSSYLDAVGSVRAVRIALRYVNRIDITLPIRDFRDFLRTYPEISTDLPQALSAFRMNLQIPYPDGVHLIVNQGTATPVREHTVSVILDIDVIFDNLDMDGDSEEIWAGFERLRDRKNQAFEACITENTRKLFS